MFSYWRHGSIALLAIVAAVGFTGCEGCEPQPDPEVGCAAYCTNVMAGCTDANALYADQAACEAACALFPATGQDGDASGDTLQCRMFHATAAVDDTTHCPHASAQGGNVCGSNCEVYCRFMVGTCATFDDVPTCLATCGGYPSDGAIGAADGNSVQCRTYHAMASSGDNSHCAHAGITGGGACGDACEAYCDQVQSNCRDATQLYPTREDCINTCGHFPADGAWDATSGNNVQCRAYHGAGAARADPTHCAHASANGGDTCGTYCEGYCDQVMGNCTGDNAQYADPAACATACGGFPEQSDFATAGDSVQCRTFHGSYPAHSDPATHCDHAGEVSTGVCEDPAPPPTEVDISGAVHELASHLNGTHTGVVGASVVAYGVQGVTPVNTTAGGAFTLANVPANGAVVLAVTAAGNQPTYQNIAVGSADMTGVGVVVAGGTWMASVNTTYGVAPTTAFACQFDAALQCVYALVVGQILDDGSNDPSGAGLPVAGMSADDITVTGGPDNVAWRKMGPYFLNANGTPGNNSTSQAAGLFVVYVEIPQTQAGYDTLHIELAAQTGTGDTAKYYGPTHTAAYRGASTAVTWANLSETGVPPGGGGGNVGFDGQIYPLFLPTDQGGYGCQGCHTNQGGANPAGGLNLWGGADVAYQSLDPATNQTRVNVDDPAASTLLTKPLYPATNHPIFAWASTSDPAYQLILTWITEGGNRFAPSARVSFVAQIKPMLGNATGSGGIGCVGCHTGGAQAGLQLDGNAGEMYDELTVEAAQDGSASGETRRINLQGYPEKSLLLTNPLAGNTEAHPMKPFANAADSRYQLLYRWISEGGQNDGYCEDYCGEVQTNCTDTAHAQYADQASCLRACGAMPRGATTDQTGDTAYCRLFHAGAANNDDHCFHAGPSGGGVCGGWCDALCRQTQASCTGDNAQFASTADCLAGCGEYPTTGAVGSTDGDTAQCRSYHVQAATTDATHCDHAGFSGANVCGAWCDVYCRDIQGYCTAGNQQFADAATCATACGGYATTGAVGDLTGNTVQCRLEHLKYAEADGSHCAHAGQASTAGACQ